MPGTPEIIGSASASSTASKATVAGAAVSGLGALSHSEWLALGGFILAVLGFFVNVWFKLDARKRQEREHGARMRRLERGMHSDTGLDQLGEDD